MENIDVEKQIEFMDKVKELNEDNKKYYILTFGCQLNENDSEKICGMLEKMNYEKTFDVTEANFIIMNTCCVRENAEEKLFGKLGEFKKLKEKNDAIIAIAGCMMQEKHIIEKINKSYPYVDIIIGTHTLHKLPEDIYNILSNRKKVRDILDIDGEIYEGLPIKRTDEKKALVTIMYGCNNFCTYCIVPYVRGRERSRDPKQILKEVKELADAGYKEITLLGQNVNSYNGGIIDGKVYNFADLLRDVNKIEGIEIIKFVSPHPKDFKDDVIEAIRDCKKVSRIIHLPLQSGSTAILKKMNRVYTKEQFIELAEKIKKNIPDAVFSTDIIVGFPGETEEDFEDTLDVVRIINFEQIFMFIYSRRVGTPADKMKDQIPEEIKHKRFDRLKELFESQIQENNRKYIGKIEKVLIEGKSKNNENMLTARTNTNKVIVLEGDENLIGKIVDVEIVSEHLWYLKGVIKK